MLKKSIGVAAFAATVLFANAAYASTCVTDIFLGQGKDAWNNAWDKDNQLLRVGWWDTRYSSRALAPPGFGNTVNQDLGDGIISLSARLEPMSSRRCLTSIYAVGNEAGDSVTTRPGHVRIGYWGTDVGGGNGSDQYNGNNGNSYLNLIVKRMDPTTQPNRVIQGLWLDSGNDDKTAVLPGWERIADWDQDDAGGAGSQVFQHGKPCGCGNGTATLSMLKASFTGGAYDPNVPIITSVTGGWVVLGEATNTDTIEYYISKGVEEGKENTITETEANTIGGSLTVGFEKDVAPFGVGVKAKMDISVEYSNTTEESKSYAESLSKSYERGVSFECNRGVVYEWKTDVTYACKRSDSTCGLQDTDVSATMGRTVCTSPDDIVFNHIDWNGCETQPFTLDVAEQSGQNRAGAVSTFAGQYRCKWAKGFARTSPVRRSFDVTAQITAANPNALEEACLEACNADENCWSWTMDKTKKVCSLHDRDQNENPIVYSGASVTGMGWADQKRKATRDDVLDGLIYIAGYSDLIRAFGVDEAAGKKHYEDYGRAEGRDVTKFDHRAYADAYADLKAAFGNSARALAQHCIEYGLAEGRSHCG